MPFKSKKQARAAFGGYLGEEMQDKAEEWAEETPDMKKLPMRVKKPKTKAEQWSRLRKGGVGYQTVTRRKK
jgi:hypothetical protein